MLCTKIVFLFWHSKQYLYTTWSELVFFGEFNEQSLVILWVNWCKNEGFWKIFTCIKLYIFLIYLFLQCKPPHINNLNVFIKFFQDFFAPTLIFQLSLSNWHCRPLQTNLPERISKNMLKPDYAFQFGSLSLFWLLKGISLLRWQRPKSYHTFNSLHCLQVFPVASEDGEIKMLNF